MMGAGIFFMAGRTGAGRNDPHGREPGEKIQEQLQGAKDDLEAIVRNQGKRSAKRRLQTLINRLQQQLDRIRKGETHHN